MSEQRHMIKRQIVEIRVRDVAHAEIVQARLSELQSRVILPLVDQACSQLSAPDRLHRIESLEVDLGVLDLDELEAELDAGLRRALPAALAAHIAGHASRAAGERVIKPAGAREIATPAGAREIATPAGAREIATPAPIQSWLELVVMFARTGTLPWWADTSQADCLQRSLQGLLDDAPVELARAMRDVAREPHATKRMAHACDDAMLAALFAALSPVDEPSRRQVPVELLLLLRANNTIAGVTHWQLRSMFWQCLLGAASLVMDDIHALYKEALVRLAAMAGISYNSLLARMHAAIGNVDAMVSAGLRSMFDGLYSEVRGYELIRRGAKQARSLPVMLAREQPELPREGQSELSEAQKDVREAPSELSEGQREESEGQREAREGKHELREALANVRGHDAHSRDDHDSRDDVRERTNRDLEEIYINNSGIIILWPFLGHFFLHIKLFENNHFKDRAAVHRGVGLLQYMVTEDARPPEYLLPLNKILCGMALGEVFEFGPPVTAEEAAECQALLGAAIEHASILRKMSIAGFRKTFLVRDGVLKNRDGSWLLQVERKAHDVVLERFPWPLAWVNLPWMQAPLRVEW